MKLDPPDIEFVVIVAAMIASGTQLTASDAVYRAREIIAEAQRTQPADPQR